MFKFFLSNKSPKKQVIKKSVNQMVMMAQPPIKTAKIPLKTPNYNPEPLIRNNTWLQSRLDYLWDNYFSDIPEANPVKIKFGRYSKYRLGSIRLNKKTKISLITITGMFKNKTMPLDVVDQTIAHEMCHYAHGFSSTRPRLHKYPHHGGVINKELRKRGMDYLIKAYSSWVREYKKTL